MNATDDARNIASALKSNTIPLFIVRQNMFNAFKMKWRGEKKIYGKIGERKTVEWQRQREGDENTRKTDLLTKKNQS